MNGIDEVIVGIDGTAAGDAAVSWAADEAVSRAARLRIVYVRSEEPVAGSYVERVAEATRARHTGLPVTAEVVAGGATEVLTRLARDAELTVVGCHERTALAEALHGATGTRVAMRAPGPVAVVRGRPDAEGPVVVGVDGSHHDNRLLAVAFEFAARRGAEVVAVRVLAPPAAPWGIGIPPLVPNAIQGRTNLLQDLTDDVQRWHDKYPTVPATARVPGGDPAGVLLDASGEARLLVLGGRPHGPASALLADSVGHRLLYHAACPLLFVHTSVV
ncbi:universal stress protein [Dactylosporangium sp. McL0621]|uniref:universal stress protein n=1 Tax=Dactylosporangium sp. McL0621 TaxID=3415678 RepID=UPI003CF23146